MLRLRVVVFSKLNVGVGLRGMVLGRENSAFVMLVTNIRFLRK